MNTNVDRSSWNKTDYAYEIQFILDEIFSKSFGDLPHDYNRYLLQRDMFSKSLQNDAHDYYRYLKQLMNEAVAKDPDWEGGIYDHIGITIPNGRTFLSKICAREWV